MAEKTAHGRITGVTIRYNIRSNLFRIDEAGNHQNLYSTLECGLDLTVSCEPGQDVRKVVKTTFADVGKVLREMLKSEAAKTGLMAAVVADPQPAVTDEQISIG